MLQLQTFQLGHLKKKTLEYFVLEDGRVFCRDQIKQARKAHQRSFWRGSGQRGESLISVKQGTVY